jgi:hypothetical protein
LQAVSNPYPIFGSQDLKDDDGQVIDSFLIETDAPPDLKDAIEPVSQPTLPTPKKSTRLITSDTTIDPTWDGYQALPADPNRQSITIRVYSPTAVATDGVRIASEKSELLTAGKILHGQDTSVFANHTGAIWIITCGGGTNGRASAPVSLQTWAVTE